MADVIDFGDYDKRIEAISKQAGEDMAAVLGRRKDFSSVAEFREHLKKNIPYVVARYENAASSVAGDNYSIWREQVLGKGSQPWTVDPYGDVYMARSEHSAYSLSHALKKAEEGDMSWEEAEAKTLQRLSTMVDRRIRSFAKDTLMANSKADRDGTGCASVPRGPRPCSFCLEMASVGVTYSFKVLKVQGRKLHDSCRCVFVPGFLGHDVTIEVDGREYSNEHIRNAMDNVRRTLGIAQNAEATKEVLNAEMRELSQRDYDWVVWGKDAGVEYEKKRKKLSEGERRTADILSGNGVSHKWVKEDSGGAANIDLIINGRKWEEKSPSGASRSAVFENLADAVGKWDRLNLKTQRRIVYSNAYGKRDDDIVSKEIKSMMSELKVKEVLFIGKDGSLSRLEKQ